MGSCPSGGGGDLHTGEIDGILQSGQKEEAAIHKLLLLGAGESGKSTLFKQMVTIYGTGFTEKDRRSSIPIIHRNLVSSIEELVKQSLELPKKVESYSNCKVTNPESLESLTFIIEMKNEDGQITPEIVRHIKRLWADPAIQATFALRAKYQLNDSTDYFLDKIDELAKPGYMPTDQDILRVRVRTTGIVENDFIIENNKFKMIDVGEQRNERKKWIHCFENVTAVLFVVDISAYDRMLYEDEKVNRLEEALNLFENICNSRWFRDTSIILFLNKSDLFAIKVEEVPLKTTFPEYTGPNNFESGTHFLEQEFLKRNHYKKPIYCHVTCATDTRNLSVVFNGVKDIVVREALAKAGLV